jgi:hypothetical protein
VGAATAGEGTGTLRRCTYAIAAATAEQHAAAAAAQLGSGENQSL